MRFFLLALVLPFAPGVPVLGQDLKPAPASRAVFLLDTSIDERADVMGRRIAKLQDMLEKDASIDEFNVLAFDVAAQWLRPVGMIKNDADGRAQARKLLDELYAEGACDVGNALTRLAQRDLPKDSGLRVILLSDATVSWGESDPKTLTARFRHDCPFRARFQCVPDRPGAGNADLFGLLEAEPNRNEAKMLSRRDQFDAVLAEVDAQVKLLAGKNGDHVKLLLKRLPDTDFELSSSKPAALLRRSDLPEAYVRSLKENVRNTDNYLHEATRRGEAKDAEGMVRALSSLVALHPGNSDVQRAVGYRLLDARQPIDAMRLFEKIRKQRPLEPHSYRDLARALEDAGKYGLAAVQYEVLLAGEWSNKYTGSLKDVVQEEYAHMMRDAIRTKKVGNKLIDVFGERLEAFDGSKLQADLRVAISWNTDNTDVDLWVIEPDGTKCFYANRTTPLGGELTQDVTQGFGPERYQMIKAKAGEYTIKVHFFSGPRNAQVVEGTHVNVVVRRNAGTPQEESQRFTIVLRRQGDLVEICRMKYGS